MTHLCLLLAVSMFACVYVLKASSFEYLGCFQNFKENISYTNSSDMSSIDCIEFCTTKKYTFASTSVKTINVVFWKIFEGKCGCGNKIPVFRVNESLCNFNCPGNVDENCSGKNESIFSVYGSIVKDILIAVVVASVFVIIIIIMTVVSIIVCKRRFRKQTFEAAPTETGISVNVKEGNYKVNATDEIRSGVNTLPNTYLRLGTTDSVIGEQGSYEHFYEVPSDPDNNESETTDFLYTNDFSDKTYQNTFLEEIAMEERQGKIDTNNTSTPELLEYEIPVQSPGVKDYYSNVNTSDEVEADISTHEDEESGDEYEVMMPRQPPVN